MCQSKMKTRMYAAPAVKGLNFFLLADQTTVIVNEISV